MTAESEASSDEDYDETGSGADVMTDTAGTTTIAFKPGLSAGIPITLQPRTPVTLMLNVSAPKDARPGDVIDLHVVQRNSKKQVVGGITVRVNVVKK